MKEDLRGRSLFDLSTYRGRQVRGHNRVWRQICPGAQLVRSGTSSPPSRSDTPLPKTPTPPTP